MTPYERIYAVVKKIPHGRVATYGQVARLANLARHARQVGYALGTLSDDRIPWHRVINAQGEISARPHPTAENEQRIRLKKEGVVFNNHGRISLSRFQWQR